MIRISPLFLLLIAPLLVSAQGEVLSPLTMRAVAEPAREKSPLNTYFIYNFIQQDLPVVDDFSVDRTQPRWAHQDDEGVVLIETIQHLVVNGVSTPDMAYSLDTTFSYMTDAGEISVTTRIPLPETIVLVNDIGTYPVEGAEVTAWPAYNVFDTIQFLSPDTLHLTSPDLVQDSLLVYEVPPSNELYEFSGITSPLILWEDDDVYVNDTYPFEPPTIGVATLDGLSRNGMPYDFMNYSMHGKADRLTSVPINLLRPASDSIYLSFYYQARGLSGDIHGQPIDSLVLEFYAPLEDHWYQVWKTPYNALDPNVHPPFQQVMIPIKEFQYLQEGFKMRFFNYATLSGSFDHWHLDYVRLAAQRNYTDTIIVDVAYVYPESSLLQTYTSVPYNKFSQSPSTLMANSVTMQQRNLDVNDRFIDFGYLAGTEHEPLTNVPTGTNVIDNANSIFNTVHPIASNFTYDAPSSEFARFYEVKFFTQTTPDFNQNNDTTRFIQEISNYYAYDDGSAEAGYGLNSAGAQLAYRFDLLGPDSLRAVRMYFNPQANLPPAPHPTTGSFLLTIWSDINSNSIIHQNFSFSSPEYRTDGLNKFIEYPLDSAIYVGGTIYVGWAQTNNVPMNIGFDKNRPNQSKIYYNVGNGWVNTSFEGSLMMRPVFVSEVDPFTGITHASVENGSDLLIYPNPAADGFYVRSAEMQEGGARIECLDAMGRAVLQSNYSERDFLSTAGIADGVYLVRMIDAKGGLLGHARLIVQH